MEIEPGFLEQLSAASQQATHCKNVEECNKRKFAHHLTTLLVGGVRNFVRDDQAPQGHHDHSALEELRPPLVGKGMASARENGERGALPPEPPVSKTEGDGLSGYARIVVHQAVRSAAARATLWPLQWPRAAGHCNAYNFSHRCSLALRFSWISAHSSDCSARNLDQLVLFELT